MNHPPPLLPSFLPHSPIFLKRESRSCSGYVSNTTRSTVVKSLRRDCIQPPIDQTTKIKGNPKNFVFLALFGGLVVLSFLFSFKRVVVLCVCFVCVCMCVYVCVVVLARWRPLPLRFCIFFYHVFFWLHASHSARAFRRGYIQSSCSLVVAPALLSPLSSLAAHHLIHYGRLIAHMTRAHGRHRSHHHRPLPASRRCSLPAPLSLTLRGSHAASPGARPPSAPLATRPSGR